MRKILGICLSIIIIRDYNHAVVVAATWVQYMEFIKNTKICVGDDGALSLKPELLAYVGGVYASRLPVFNEDVDQSAFIESVILLNVGMYS